MNKIRKLFDSLWYNKERIVLGVMVCILLWHVYGIFNPEAEEAPKALTVPDPNKIKGVIEKLAKIPELPEERPIGQWEGIYTPNPFWALSAQSTVASRTSATAADISLLQIQKGPGGAWTAQLKTKIPRWYSEGESFESFQLIKIHPENNTVEVRSDGLGKIITLRAQGN